MKTTRIGLVVDSACDLPRDFIDANDIVVMPITVRIGDATIEDNRDPDITRLFYRRHFDKRSDDFAESIPYSSDQIEALFLDRLVLDYDHVFCLTITGARSPIYEHAQQAASRILARSKGRRAASGISTPFGIYVLSSRNMFTGQGVLAAEAVRLIRAGLAPAEIGMRLHALTEQIHTYLVPADLFHIYKRASKKGDKSLSWGAYTVGQMLDMKPILRCHLDQTGPVAKVRGFEAGVERLFANAERQLRAGLKTPHVCISYGGEPETVETLPGFAALRATAKQQGVSLLVSMMSKTAAINVGPGAVSLALGATGHEFE